MYIVDMALVLGDKGEVAIQEIVLFDILDLTGEDVGEVAVIRERRELDPQPEPEIVILPTIDAEIAEVIAWVPMPVADPRTPRFR